MTEQERIEILERAKMFFRSRIVSAHIEKSLARAGALKSYNVNPFLFKYLANFLKGNDDPRSIAEALIYPRILGSSINTSFGMRIQSLLGELFKGFGSATKGIDIEFVDAIDGRRKYCQVKAGPNTINHDDITTIINHFKDARNTARTNNLRIDINDMIVGIVYGEPSELSANYLDIEKEYPVIIGKEFWYRLTGQEDFYYHLIEAFGEVAKEIDASEKLENAIQRLTQDVKAFLEE